MADISWDSEIIWDNIQQEKPENKTMSFGKTLLATDRYVSDILGAVLDAAGPAGANERLSKNIQQINKNYEAAQLGQKQGYAPTFQEALESKTAESGKPAVAFIGSLAGQAIDPLLRPSTYLAGKLIIKGVGWLGRNLVMPTFRAADRLPEGAVAITKKLVDQWNKKGFPQWFTENPPAEQQVIFNMVAKGKEPVVVPIQKATKNFVPPEYWDKVKAEWQAQPGNLHPAPKVLTPVEQAIAGRVSPPTRVSTALVPQESIPLGAPGELEKSMALRIQQKQALDAIAQSTKAERKISQKPGTLKITSKYKMIPEGKPVAPEIVKSATKEPWQMTREEFESNYYLRGTGNFPSGVAKEPTGGQAAPAQLGEEWRKSMPWLYSRSEGGKVHIFKNEQMTPHSRNWRVDAIPKEGENPIISIEGKELFNTDPHKFLVQQAIPAGKPVPPEVMAEYPDLAKGKPPAPYAKGGYFKILNPEEIKQTATEMGKAGVAGQVASKIENLNIEKFPNEIRPAVAKIAGATPETFKTPRVPIETMQSVGEKLKDFKLSNQLLNAPEGALSTEIITRGNDLSKLIGDTLGKDYVEQANRIPILLDELSSRRRLGSEMGRGLRVFREELQIKYDLSKAMKKNMAQLAKDPNVDASQKRFLIDGYQKIMKAVVEGKRPDLLSKFYYVWLNSILSNPVTHVKNTIGNLMFASDKIIQKGFAVPWDIAQSTVKGTERTHWLGEIPAMIKGVLSKEQIPEEIMALAKGTKLEMARPIGGRAGQVIGGPTKLLELEDTLSKNLIGRMELYRGRFLESKGLGKGEDLLPKSIADEMLYRTFQNDPAKLAQGLMEMRREAPGAEFVIPFIKTPANLLNVAIERSPAQAANILYKALGKKYYGNQKMLSTDLANLTTGAATTAWVIWQYNKGNITGGVPKNANERAEFYRQGKKPYSVKIGNKWIGIGMLDPLGSTFTGITTAVDKWKEGKELPTSERVLSMSASIGRIIGTRSYLSSLTAIAAAMEDPDRWGSAAIKNFTTSLVPPSGTLKFASDMTDNYYRETNNIFQRVINRIPITSKTLPTKLNVFAEPQAGRRAGAFGIGNVSQDELNPLLNEIPIHIQSARLGKEKLTPEQVRYITEQSGPAIKRTVEALIRNPQYMNAPPEVKERIIDNLVNAIRTKPKAEVRMQQQLKADIKWD